MAKERLSRLQGVLLNALYLTDNRLKGEKKFHSKKIRGAVYDCSKRLKFRIALFLIEQKESIKMNQTRIKSYYRSLKNLEKKGLVRIKDREILITKKGLELLK